MSLEITLCIEDSGEMYIKSGEKEETPEMESAEGGEKTPVKSVDEAVAMIKQMAESASMAPPEEGELPEEQMMPPEDDIAGQEEGLEAGFRGR